MNKLLIIAKRDILTFFTNFYGVGFRTLNLLLYVVIFAFVLAKIVPSNMTGGLSYIQFFALGATVLSLFGASYLIGRDVYWDRESGFLNYLLSLPFSRTDIVLGRSLGGATRSLLNMLPIYCIALVFVPSALVNVLVCVLLLFVFSFGLCGLGILLSTAIRKEDKWRLATRLLELILVRSSTAMYPIFAMPVWLQVFTRMNPVTYAVESTRVLTSQPLSATPILDVVTVLLFSAFVGVLGISMYSRKVEGGPTE